MNSLIAYQIRFQVRYIIMCYMNNSGSNLLSLKIIFMRVKSQPRFHARRLTSHFKSTLAAIGGSYKIANNIFYVP